ncbi:hypothetical protein E4U54_005886, partial [Claviceps lovelessii]
MMNHSRLETALAIGEAQASAKPHGLGPDCGWRGFHADARMPDGDGLMDQQHGRVAINGQPINGQNPDL